MSTDTARFYARPISVADPKVARGVWTKVINVLKTGTEVFTNRGGEIVSIYPLVAKAPSNVQRTDFTKNTTPGVGRTYPWNTTVTWDQASSDNPVIGYGNRLAPAADPSDYSLVDTLPLTPRSDVVSAGRLDQLGGTAYVYGVRARAADGLHSVYTEINFTTPPYPVPTGVISALDVELFQGTVTVIWTAGADGEFVSDYLFRYKIGTGEYSGYLSMGFNDAYGAGFKNFGIPNVSFGNALEITVEVTPVGPGGTATPSTITFSTPGTPVVNQNRYYLGYMRIGLTPVAGNTGYSFQSFHESQGWSYATVTGAVTLYDHVASGNYPRNYQASYMKIYPFNAKGSGQPVTTGWVRKAPNPIFIDPIENDTAVSGIGGYSHWRSQENALSGFDIVMGWSSSGMNYGMAFYGGSMKPYHAPSFLGYTLGTLNAYVYLWRKNANGLFDGTNNAGSPAYNPSYEPGMLPFLYLHAYPSKAYVNIQNPGAGWAGPYVSGGNRLLLDEQQWCVIPANWGDELLRGGYWGIGLAEGESSPNYFAGDLGYYVSYRYFHLRSNYFTPAWRLQIVHDS